MCSANRYLTAANYASIKCREFSVLIPELDGMATGIQASHEERLWVSCAIFCKRKDISVYYSPRLELNDFGGGMEAYFPDGTFCHNDGTQDYFCLHHHCLPENFQFSKGSKPDELFEDDVPFWLGNASPDEQGGRVGVNEMLMEYMSLDEEGKRPLRRYLAENGKLKALPRDWDFGEDDVKERRRFDGGGGFYFQ